MLWLDEADQMLDMGFVNDVKKIVSLLKKQTNTLSLQQCQLRFGNWLKCFLTNPETVTVSPVSSTAEVEQHVYFVEKTEKEIYYIT
jgi:ATP-dependent RNA helicase RhlE